jgi:hypothetical protein
MTTFTIDTDNNITAHAAALATQDNLVVFASQKELSKATAEWPISRLIETWNSFAGAPPFGDLKPVKKFENRAKATTRIWAAIQKLEPTPAPQAAPKPAKKAKAAKAAADASKPAPDASTPRVPRAFSKQAIVRDMLLRAGGATLQEIMAETGWQKHTVRGLHQHPCQEDRDRDHQHPARERPGARLRSHAVGVAARQPPGAILAAFAVHGPSVWGA